MNSMQIAHVGPSPGAAALTEPTGCNLRCFGHTLQFVAALFPVLGLALGPAVAHELAAGARAKGDAGLFGQAAVGTLPV